jgi:4-methyl-5(b-hydroxyethyl)-thiazole monophosphate biosynthesis
MMADGFEEIEALAVVDVLRRAGIDVFTVSITNKNTVTGAHKIQVIADLTIKEAALEDADMIVLPGGMPGAQNLYDNPVLEEALEKRVKNNKWIAAICAAPFIPGKRGYLKGKEAICYPGFEKYLNGAIIKEQNVVISDNFITSKGPGTALHFAFAIVSVLKDQKTASELAKAMQIQ